MLKKYFGNSLHVENSTIDDEWINIKDTDWYKDMAKKIAHVLECPVTLFL